MNTQSTARTAKFQRPERNVADMNRICGDAFSALKIPAYWKFECYERILLTEDPESEIQCIAAVFLDTQTRNIDLKRYRVNFHTFSERLSICQEYFIDYGKRAYSCKISNKTPIQINEYFETILNSNDEKEN